jgi:hypothetical protein
LSGGNVTEENTNPRWFDNEEEVDSFIDTHRGRLIEKLGLSDLFADPSPAPAPKKSAPKEGGGEQVRSQDMEASMSSLVAALTKGVEMGAALGSAKAVAEKPEEAPAPPKTKKSWFFGEVEV